MKILKNIQPIRGKTISYNNQLIFVLEIIVVSFLNIFFFYQVLKSVTLLMRLMTELLRSDAAPQNIMMESYTEP